MKSIIPQRANSSAILSEISTGLGPGILTFINEQMGTKLDTAKTGFVRIEKCVDTSKPDHAKIHGIVTDLEFNGILTKYTISCMGQKVK